jgi:hypothetical protein
MNTAKVKVDIVITKGKYHGTIYGSIFSNASKSSRHHV